MEPMTQVEIDGVPRSPVACEVCKDLANTLELKQAKATGTAIEGAVAPSGVDDDASFAVRLVDQEGVDKGTDLGRRSEAQRREEAGVGHELADDGAHKARERGHRSTGNALLLHGCFLDLRGCARS